MINLQLTLEEVNAVLEALGAQPYTKAVDLITSIREQAIPQVEQPKPTTDIVEGELV